MSDPGQVHAEIGRTIGYVVAAVIGVIVVGFVAAWGFGFFSDTTAERRGQTDQQEQTTGDGAYRIARYDQFFDRCQAIVGLENQITLSEQALAADGTDPTARFYDQQNLRAQQGLRLSLVSAYNADAAKEGTAAQFRSSQLPARIDPNGTTTCA